MYRRCLLWGIAVLSLFFWGGGKISFAEDRNLSDLTLQELLDLDITTIAGDKAKKITQTSSVVSVTTKEDIKAMGALTLDEVLQAVPGVYSALSAFSPSVHSFVVRGGYDQADTKSLFMLNGVRLDTFYTGAPYIMLTNFPVALVERIEIIRGPGSAVHGADAFSGVINIVTTNYATHEQKVSGYVGSLDTGSVSVNIGDSIGDFSFDVKGQFATTEEGNEIIQSDFQTILDQIFGTQVSRAPAKAGLGSQNDLVTLSAAYQKLKGQYSYSALHTGATAFGAANALDVDLGSHTRGIQHFASLGLTGVALGDTINIDIEGQYRNFDRDSYYILFPAGAFGGLFSEGMVGAPRSNENEFVAKATLTADLGAHYVTFGIGNSYIDLHAGEIKNFDLTLAPIPLPLPTGLTDVSNTSKVFLENTYRENAYAFLQDDYKIIDDLSLVAGVRYDWFSSFGATVNPRASLIYDVSDAVVARLIYGRAFRAPSAAETGLRNNPVFIGSPDLKPEVIDSVEAALSYSERAITLFSNAYIYRMKETINAVPLPNGLGALNQNVGKVKGYGFELEGRYKPVLLPIYATANYTYQVTKDDILDEDLGFVPTYKAYGRIDWEFVRNYTFGTQLTWIGDIKREPGDTRSPMDGYAKLDLIFRAKNIFDRCDGFVTAKNILGEDLKSPATLASTYRDDFPITSDVMLFAGVSISLE